jgi:hypothetical protein
LLASLAVLTPVVLLAAFYALGVPVCGSKVLFGLPCPGCGMSRAVVALLRGDIALAARLHPAVFAVVPVLGVAFLRTLLVQLGARSRLARAHVPARVWLGLGLALVALWGVRLAGGLGGLPDPVDPASGQTITLLRWLL